MSSISDAHDMVRRPPMPPADSAPAEPAYGEPPSGFTLSDFMRVLKQRKAMVLITFVLLFMAVAGVTFVMWRWFPAYPAEAFLELKPPPESVFALSDDRLVSPNIMELLVNTEAQKLKRLDVLAEVLSLKEIKETEFYRWYDSFEECLFDLESLLSSAPVPETRMIRVRFACRRADEAQLIVQTLVDRYRSKFKQETEESDVQALKDIRATRTDVERQLEEKQAELTGFRARTDVGALESEIESNIRVITDMRYMVDTYDARAAELQAQLNVVQGVDPRSLPITPEDRVIVEADPLLRLYRQQVENLDIQIETSEELMVGENHRHLKMLKAQRDGYYRLETARREELLDDLRERKVSGLREELARVRAVQAQLQERLEEIEARQADLDNARVRYEALVKDEERLQKQLEMIEASLIEAQHASQSTPRATRLTLVQPPRKAVMPSRPNIPVYLAGGFLLSVAGAIGLAFLREVTDKAVRTPVDVARFGRLSVLGTIPELDEEEAEVEEIEQATRKEPQSLVAEAFRQVRANLVFSGPVETQDTLLITSPGPGNGKSAIAINLAVTFAQANERVLLVDCNFRRPAVRLAFPNAREDGLSNVLIGKVRLGDVVVPSEVPHLDVVSSGPMPPSPAELLGSDYMRTFIEEARARYDRIIFDGPPVLLISDALVVARWVGGVIVVARAIDTAKGVLRRAREQLDKINAHVVGAILNGVRSQPGGYYRQQYREFYDYGSDETIPRELPGGPSEDDSRD